MVARAFTLILILASTAAPSPAVFSAPGRDASQDVSQIDLYAYPVLPANLGIARDVFARGQRLGRDPGAFSKVGDCNSADWLFLHPFGVGRYNLGDYADLQAVIDVYEASFDVRSQAAHNGLTVSAAHDPIWANPAECNAGESPLDCEYRLRNPAISLIMFGSNDIFALTPEQFDADLRLTLDETLRLGIVPVLSTFPRNLDFPDRSLLFNQFVVQAALDYQVPLVNLWLALEPLPHHGIDEDGFHLNGPVTRAGDFASPHNLQTGYPARNLVTLQALDIMWRGVMMRGS